MTEQHRGAEPEPTPDGGPEEEAAAGPLARGWARLVEEP